MARKPVHKSALGRRLAELRERLGLDREQLASTLETVSASALANYERGDNVPDASVLAALRGNFNVDVNWLVTGEGEMFASGATEEGKFVFSREEYEAPEPGTAEFDIQLLQRLGDVVEAVFVEVKQTPPRRAVTFEAGQLYNELLRMTSQINDPDVQDALIPVARQRFKNRLLSAEPGTGKRSAS